MLWLTFLIEVADASGLQHCCCRIYWVYPGYIYLGILISIKYYVKMQYSISNFQRKN